MNPENTHPQISDQSLERFASRILVYSVKAALIRVAEDYMRQWIRWQPGVLFRYGCLGLQAEEREVYLGGLTTRQTLFVLVPESLYERRRRAELLQIAGKLLQTQDQTILCAYCDLVEQETTETPSVTDHPAWDAEARAPQVSYWVALLKRRKEEQTRDGRG